jgi:hypothetical protein
MVRESVSLGILILVWVIRSIFKGQSLSATEKLPLLGQKEILYMSFLSKSWFLLGLTWLVTVILRVEIEVPLLCFKV